MKTDWEKYWERYDDFFWRLGVWRKRAVYSHLLKNVNLSSPKILELGSGSGVNSLNIAEILGARKITLVDFQDKAIEISKKLVKESNIKPHVNFLKKDVRHLNLNEKFDIVHSDGLIEHFYGEERLSVFKKHVQFCKKSGFVIIVVPCKSVQYNMLKTGYKIFGRWVFMEEPFTKEELYGLCERSNLEIVREYTSPFLHKVGILANRL